ncbi:MAG: DUF5118 domain-containing protein, partial [Gemmatimonadota bacterium]
MAVGAIASRLWMTVVALTALGCAGTSATQDVRPPAAEDDPDEDAPRAYAEVVTAEAASDAGLFTVHRNGGDWLFEIPDSLLGRDMLLIS